MKHSPYSQEKDKASPLSPLKITQDVLHNEFLKISGRQKQGKSEKILQPREAEGDITTKCNPVSVMR